ncbi:transcriptional regulator Spx [Allofustis seminis]|uniref:transcriptional regulator Spx n=1 Tax=Allofustis seminis TaxID=166939 RepID=UPI00047647B4|nr:transcriptional regulator Spx [Allofustis seminis]
MITLFLSTSCTSCRRARDWLDEHNMSYVERDIIKEPPTMEELQEILSRTENGTGDIISSRSKAFKDLNINIDELSMNTLYKVIQENPNILKKPILLDEKRIQIGYHEDDIRKFVSRTDRQLQLVEAKIQIEENPVTNE